MVFNILQYNSAAVHIGIVI